MRSVAGRDRIPYVCIAGTVNMAGGQPISMRNLREVRDLTRRHGIPVILDATRAIDLGLKSAYVNRGVRTVRRWEHEEGMPVHRQVHRVQGSVYAYRSEIDAWRKTGECCTDRERIF